MARERTAAVRPDDLFAVIDRHLGEEVGPVELGRMVGRDESRIRRLRKQRWIQLGTADDILTHLGLSHFLSTGEVPVYEYEDGPLRWVERKHEERGAEVYTLFKKGYSPGTVARKLGIPYRRVPFVLWHHLQEMEAA